MGAKFQERGGHMLDLNMLKPVLRAYALGYASSTIPRLLGLLRTLRRQDRTIQEKLDLVSPASALLFMHLNFQSSPIVTPPAKLPMIFGGRRGFSASLPAYLVLQDHTFTKLMPS